MRINTNLMALNTKNQLKKTNKGLSSKMEKLSSGKRINKAADDASGLAISQKMRAQIRGLDQVSRNIQDSVSLIQTGESALEEIGNITQRMRELSVQAANDTLVDEDRGKIQNELNSLKKEISIITNKIEFNNIQLLNGIITNDTYTRSFEPALEIPKDGEVKTETFDEVFPNMNISMDVYEDNEGKVQVAFKESHRDGINILGSVEYDKINDKPDIEWIKDTYIPADTLSKTKDGFMTSSWTSISRYDENGENVFNKSLDLGEHTSLVDIKQTSDGEYYGFTEARHYDVDNNYLYTSNYVISVDSAGEIKDLGYIDSKERGAKDFENIIELKNNAGYVYSGSVNSQYSDTNTDGDTFYYLEDDSILNVFNDDLTEKWSKEYEGYDEQSGYTGAYDYLSDVVEDSSGNIIAAGIESGKEESFITQKGVIHKYSAEGNNIYSEYIDGGGIEILEIDSHDSLILKQSNGDVKKLDGDLNEEWSISFIDQVDNIELLKDDNILINTRDSENNMKTIMLDENGDKKWEVNLGTKDEYYYKNKTIRINDGNFIFTSKDYLTLGKLSTNETLKMSLDQTRGDKNIVKFEDATLEFKNGKLSKLELPYDGSLDVQTGANEGQKTNIAIDDMRPEALGMTNGYPKVVPREEAEVSIEISDYALRQINAARSKLGAKQNALEHTQKSVNNTSEQLQAAESKITDADLAKEMMDFTRYNILKEATQSMLSQAKTIPEQVLNLLKNG